MSKAQMEGERISRFQQMAGVDDDTARGYLEACAWDLNMAVSMYYEAGGNASYEPTPTGRGLYAGKPSPARPLDTSGGDSLPIAMNIADRTPIHAPAPAAAAGGGRGGPRMMSIGDLARDEDKDREHYTGGHKSGMAVQDPTGEPKEEDIVGSMFRSAKDRGAQTRDEYEREKSKPFTGSAFRLGENVAAPSQPTGSKPLPKSVTITFWKDGFSVGTKDEPGELRSLEDPSNRAFLAQIQEGRVPQELTRIVGPGDVDVNLVDKKQEKYKKPKIPFKAFKGGGNRLGSDGPTYQEVQPPAATSSTSAASAPKPTVDESRPTTSIQLRLADGTRLVAKFNLDSLVGDVYAFVQAARPMQGDSFELRTAFPPQPLTNMGETVQEAGIAGAALVQRMK